MNRPSFIFILADDLGYADLGCYGGRARRARSPNLDRLARRGLALHRRLFELRRLLAHPLRARHRPLPIPPARRRRRADRQPHRARQPGARAAAGASDPGFAAARRRLRDRARRQVASRLPAALRPAEERLPGVLRADERRRGLLQALRLRRQARPLRGRGGSPARGLPHRSAVGARGAVRSPAEGRALPPLAALHRAALAVGDARGRGRVAAHRRTSRTPTAARCRPTSR